MAQEDEFVAVEKEPDFEFVANGPGDRFDTLPALGYCLCGF
jgi:hypothetical protein